MASTYTTERRLRAAAMRWGAKVEAGRDASEEETVLLQRIREHHVVELRERRWFDRARRNTKGT